MRTKRSRQRLSRLHQQISTTSLYNSCFLYFTFQHQKAQTFAIRHTVHHKPQMYTGNLRPMGAAPITFVRSLPTVVIVWLSSNMSLHSLQNAMVKLHKIILFPTSSLQKSLKLCVIDKKSVGNRRYCGFPHLKKIYLFTAIFCTEMLRRSAELSKPGSALTPLHFLIHPDSSLPETCGCSSCSGAVQQPYKHRRVPVLPRAQSS